MAGQVQVSAAALVDPSLLIPPRPDVVLVAGQALATWVDALDIPLPSALAAGVTVDQDYLGTLASARAHYELLREHGLHAVLHIPEPDHITPNSAKIVIHGDDRVDVRAEIDYLATLHGFVGADETRLRSRAIPVLTADGERRLLVMHPFDCLKSRIHNLAGLPQKRNDIGVAQARLAIRVVREYLLREIQVGRVRKVVLPLVEAVIELAVRRDSERVLREFGIDPMEAIPWADLPQETREHRLPQVTRYLDRRRYGRRGGKHRLYEHAESSRRPAGLQ